LNTETVIKN